jgi:D-glycero-D-manno-heptose 1,7-bisphosphate phosphatase
MKPAVFLDRDGTMIHDVGYLRRPADVRWFASTIDAVRVLNRAGFLVCVTTNQSGIGRGHYTEADLAEIHAEMSRVLDDGGARIDGWFYCPHHPDAEVPEYRAVCECRKPSPGMIKQATARFPIDLARSFVIGDKLLDLGLAQAVGARGILVATGYGSELLRAYDGRVPHAAFAAANLMEAASWAIREQAAERDVP